MPQTVIRGDIKPNNVGGTNIQDGSVAYVAHESDYSKGYECNIGSDVMLVWILFMHARFMTNH